MKKYATPTPVPASRKRMLWTIIGSVLGASIIAGGAAGFLVGSKGGQKPQDVRVLAQTTQQGNHTAARVTPSAAPKPAKEVASKSQPAASKEGSPAKGQATLPARPAASTRASVPEASAIAGTKPGPAAPVQPTAKPAAPVIARKDTVVEKKPVATSVSKPALASPASETKPSVVSQVPAKGPSQGSMVSVKFASNPPGADVWVDGQDKGRTPLQVNLRPGAARIVLVHAGYAPATVEANLAADSQVSKDLQAVAPPMNGEARFRAECSTQGKLPIVVDGKHTGILCPFSKMRVDPGPHKIGLFVPRTGQVHEKEVTLPAGVRSIVFGD